MQGGPNLPRSRKARRRLPWKNYDAKFSSWPLAEIGGRFSLTSAKRLVAEPGWCTGLITAYDPLRSLCSRNIRDTR